MSGIRIPVREFLGRRIEAEADDNTVLTLDFGDGRFAVAHGTAAGAISEQSAAPTFFGTRRTIDGVLLNGERFAFDGHEQTLDAPVTDWEAQTRVLPHVTGPHRQIAEAHIFEDLMQLVGWIADGTPSPVKAEHARHVIDIIESGYRAAEIGATQDLTTTFELTGTLTEASGRPAR
jgi:predicted dehydrogenase